MSLDHPYKSKEISPINCICCNKEIYVHENDMSGESLPECAMWE